MGKPLVFTFSGNNLEKLQKINLDGVMDHIDPQKTADQVTATVAGLQIDGAQGPGPIYLEKGLADLGLSAALNNNSIDARFRASVSSASIAIAETAGADRLEGTLLEALKEISAFDLKADIEGEVDDYRVSLSSNVDDVLKNALTQQFKKKAGAFEKSLNQAIAEKTKQPLAESDGLLSDLNSIQGELISRLDQGAALQKEVLRKAGLK